MVTMRKGPRITARGMLREGTPLEDYTEEYGLFVKREDRACPLPGPPFSKTRGVYAWVEKREEEIIGVLDTYHSQAGHAVARACQVLGKKCLNFYPEFKHEPGPREPQLRAASLGADLIPLKAGRSAILYHAARKETERAGGVMIPNALKLKESVTETAREVPERDFDWVVIPASSGTIAAGVILGFSSVNGVVIPGVERPKFIVHLGYSRSHEEVFRYLWEASGVKDADIELIDEGYAYKDVAENGETPPWPCNPYYDLKAFRWWLSSDHVSRSEGSVLFWNVG